MNVLISIIVTNVLAQVD